MRLSKGSEKFCLLSRDTAIREIYPLLDLSFISARVFIYTYTHMRACRKITKYVYIYITSYYVFLSISQKIHISY